MKAPGAARGWRKSMGSDCYMWTGRQTEVYEEALKRQRMMVLKKHCPSGFEVPSTCRKKRGRDLSAMVSSSVGVDRYICGLSCLYRNILPEFWSMSMF